MKNSTIFFSLLCISVLFFHCKKEESKPIYAISDYDFEPLAIKVDDTQCTTIKRIEGLGEKQWLFNTSTIYFDYIDNFSIFLNTYEDTTFCYIRENIMFYGLAKKEHRIELPNPDNELGFAEYVRLIDDGHVGEAIWYVIEDSNSFIEITKIDTVKREMMGIFEVHFLRDTSWLRPNTVHPYSDKISFLEGEFEVGY